MVRLVYYVIGLALFIGIGEAGARMVMEMAGLAVRAQQHDQISYSKWNRMLWYGRSNTNHSLKNVGPSVRPTDKFKR